MRFKYNGKSVLMYNDEGNIVQISPGEEVELKRVPSGFEKKFIEIKKTTEKKVKRNREEYEK